MSFFRRKKPEERAASKPVSETYAAPDGPSMRELLYEKREEHMRQPEVPSPVESESAVEDSITALPPEAAAPTTSQADPEPVADTGFPWPPKETPNDHEPPTAPLRDASENVAVESNPPSPATSPEDDETPAPQPPPFPLRSAIMAESALRARKPRTTKSAQNRKSRTMTRKPAKPKITHRKPAKQKSAKNKVAKPNAAPRIQIVQRAKASAEPVVRPAVPSSAPATFPSNVQDSRQAFVVLAWFEYLLRRIPARELPYLIDQYRKIGWIDDPLHAWFIKMAEGVGGTRTKAGETQFARQSARGLVTIHKETLRFLNQLRAAAPRVQANGSGPNVQFALTHKQTPA